MKLSTFIRNNIEAILQEWEQFADSIQAKSGDMVKEALRDHAKLMLEYIADDLDKQKGKHEQAEKSKGLNPDSATRVAVDRGLVRMRSGFEITDVISGYRFMRSTVIRLWHELRPDEEIDYYDLIRYNEALDQLIYETVGSFSAELERRVQISTRELLETQAKYLHVEKLSAIGKTSAAFAHEFNAPLQAVMTILQGLKNRENLGKEDREDLGLAISESYRMKNLILSLQHFKLPSADNKTLMDVHASIDYALLLCRSDFKQKRISTVLNYTEQLPQILAIPDQIKQVILNLLNNAANACVPNGGEITISTWGEEQTIAIAIQDTGVGINSENLDQIVEPFYTAKPEIKGTGPGLSVCHGIV